MIIKKEIRVASHNCAGWNWRINEKSFENRLKAILEKAKNEDPDIVGLQETYASDKYIKIIKVIFPEEEYIIITPRAYDREKNKKSVIALMILKKKGLLSFEHLHLPELEDSMRLNYVEAEYDFGTIRPLNLWIPQIDLNGEKTEGYRQKRADLKATFIKAVQDEADKWGESNQLFLPFGDFNLTSKSMYDLALYTESGMLVEPLRPEDKGASTWHNKNLGPGADLDHIMYSSRYSHPVAYKITRIDYSPITDGLSDHAMLFGSVCLVE